MAFSGDVLIHSGVWKAAATGAGYDFSPMLAPVAAQLSAADVAVCHLEVTLARPEDPLSSYPRFRAPRELAGDLAAAGFDGCSVASNHALDFGEQGVVATLGALDEAGLQHAGTARTPEEDAQPARYEVDGIAVAQLSYAYGFNGFVEPADRPWLVDQIDPAVILADAQAARAAGAEVVLVSLHWGNEYRHEVVEAQQSVADALAAVPGAVDLVVGHHAHVVQPISKVGDMWVVWGMGNMLSSNSPRCCTTEATDGVIVTVTIGDLGPTRGDPGVKGISFTPTWNERTTYRVLPAAETLAAGAVPADLAAALRASYERTVGHVLALGGLDLGVAPTRRLP
jgi:poly-gamma-glutamate synthesis protein (capsule biosynthesis protein)